MGLADGIGTVEIKLDLADDVFAGRHIHHMTVVVDSDRILRNDKGFKFHNGMYAHLLATVFDLRRGILDDIAILVDHCHTVNVDIAAGWRGVIVAGLLTTVGEGRHVAVLFRELLVLDLGVLNLTHDGGAVRTLEANDLVVDDFTAQELALELLCHGMAEVIGLIPTAGVTVGENDSTGAGDVAVFQMGMRRLAEEALEEGSLVIGDEGQVAGATGRAVHLQSQLDNIPGFELIEVVRQLFGFDVLIERRGDVRSGLSLTTGSVPAGGMILMGDVLAADLFAIDHVDGVAGFQVGDRTEACETGEGKIQTVRFLPA